MSDSTTRLGVSITATDNASLSIRQLQATIESLRTTLNALTADSNAQGRGMSSGLQQATASINLQIAAIEREISTRGTQATAIRNVTAALKEQGEAAAVVHRSLQQGINASLGIDADRSIISATASSRVLATSLSAAAEADGRLRDAAIATAAALRLQQREQLLANIEASKAAREGTVSSVTFGRQLRGEGGRQQIDAALGTKTANEQAEASTTRLAQRETIYQNLLESRLTRLGQITPLQRLADASFTQVPTAGFSKYVDELLGVSRASKIAAGDLIGTASAAGVASSRIGASATSSTQGIRHLVAAFDSLSRGQRGALFGTIGAAARDAGFGVGALSASMGGLVAVMGTGAILHHAEALGKWAADTRAAASAAAMSIESYSQLRGALELTGQKEEEADATLRRLAVNLGEAIANPASLAAQAFHNLGVSQEQLTASGGDLAKVLPILADNFTKQADTASKAQNYSEIAGRGYENLFKILQNGKIYFEELQQRAREMGLTLTNETGQSAEETGQKVEVLTLALKGDLTQAFIALGPVIQGLTKTLEAFAAGVAYIGSAIYNMRQNMGIIARGGALEPKQMGPYGPQPQFELQPQQQVVPPLTKGGITPQEQTAHDAALKGLEAGQAGGDSRAIHIAETQAYIAEIKKRVEAAQMGSKEKLQAETELYRKQTELLNEQASAGGAAAKQSSQDFIAAEKLKLAEAQGNSTKIKAIYDEMIAYTTAKYGAGAAETLNIEREKVQAINAARLQEINESAKQEEQQTRATRQDATLSAMAQGKFTYQGQEKQEGPSADVAKSAQFLAEADKIKAAFQSTIGELTNIANTAEAGSKVQQDAQQKIVEVTANYKTQEIALYEKAGNAAVAAINKMIAPWNNLFDGIGSQFESLSSNIIKDLIAPQQDLIKVGLTTIKFNEQGNEMRAAFRTAIVGIASDFGKAIETSISHVIANALSSGAANSIGELLTQTLQKAVSGIAGSAAGSALGNVAGSAAGSVGGSAATTAAITAGATATTTGISTAIATAATTQITAITAASTAIVGAITTAATTEDALLVGVNAKPSLLGFTYAQGGIVPSAAGGMVVGGGSGASLAILHPQEMVLPANISNGLQNAIAGGGSSSGASSTSAIIASIQGSGAATINALTSTQTENLNALNNIQNTLAQQKESAGPSALMSAFLPTNTKGILGDFLGLPFLGALAGGGIVPSAAGGMVAGGMGATLAILHSREMVLPAPISQGLQSMIAGTGGRNTSNNANLTYSPTINSGGRGRGGTGMSRSEFGQMMALHSGAMLGEARNMVRNGFRG